MMYKYDVYIYSINISIDPMCFLMSTGRPGGLTTMISAGTMGYLGYIRSLDTLNAAMQYLTHESNV